MDSLAQLAGAAEQLTSTTSAAEEFATPRDQLVPAPGGTPFATPVGEGAALWRGALLAHSNQHAQPHSSVPVMQPPCDSRVWTRSATEVRSGARRRHLEEPK
jgi:hypothetical protein